MGDFDCRECGADLRAEVAAALEHEVKDLGFRGDRAQDGGRYRVVDVECRTKRHPNSFRLWVPAGNE